MTDDITTDDIDSAYKVIETMRENDLFDTGETTQINDVHCHIQRFEAFLAEQDVIPEKREDDV